MRRFYQIPVLTVALTASLLQGCRKENGIDNNSVIKTPYSLYMTDVEGALYNTNDGNLYKSVFPVDGFPSRAIATSASNIIWIKNNVHLSENNGKQFNPTYTSPAILALWQPMILDEADHNRVYICSTEGNGIALSEDHGKTWKVDPDWNPNNSTAPNGINSITRLKNGNTFAHSLQSATIYKRTGRNGLWTQVTATGTALPIGIFYISHVNNTLVAVDFSGFQGAWYSNDEGGNWSKYTGLPATRTLYTAVAPFEETLLIGDDSAGIYRLNPNTTQFVASNRGLATNTVVRSIVGKSDIFKNGTEKRYVYIATSTGIYRSEDLGQNWVMVKTGSYVSIN